MRYEFDEIVATLGEEEDVPDNEPMNIKGYSLYDWRNYGIIGWDEMLSTYFIQLIFRGREHDEHGWWLGTSQRDIPDFSALCKILDAIFGVPSGFLEHVDCIKKH